MKKFSLILVSLSLLFVSLSHSKGIKVKIIVDKAKIYLEPNVNSYPLETLSKGAILSLYGTPTEGAKWFNVFYKSEEKEAIVSGFVEASNVELMIPKEVIEEKKVEPPEEVIEEVVKPPEKIIKPEIEKPKVPEVPPIEVPAPERIKIGPKKGFGILLGYGMPSDKNYDGSFLYGANFHLGITKNIAVEISASRFQSNVEESNDGLDLPP